MDIASERSVTPLEEAALGSTDRFLTVLTYNIHHGRGRDGRVDLERICAVIQEASPDLVALQEVDRGMTRSGWIDQGERIAELLQMKHVAGHNWFLEEGAYGNVFLSRWPATLLGNLDLSLPKREPRGCLLTEVHLGGSTLLVGSLHLGLGPLERNRQCLTILNQLHLLFPGEPILLMGDFNSLAISAISRRFRKVYADAFQKAGKGAGATFRKAGLSFRLDYIYATHHLLPLNSCVLRSEISRTASDHFPLVAKFLWKREDENRKDSETWRELLSDRASGSD